MEKQESEAIKLTAFSHGSGCGCKIAPADLENILQQSGSQQAFENLLVGAETRDDAAVMKLDNGTCIISTTDFFTPIVDDAFDFGRIASANALSDVYAMGGKPLMAVAILGWPIEKLGATLAGKVVEGARNICTEAGIPLAGGHSIDSKEPFFGLAVTGTADTQNLKQNSQAHEGDLLYLTKPLGVGILSTAMKRGLASDEDQKLATSLMTKLNDVGAALASIKEVHAMTDVTGFGLAGHLLELCEGASLSAELNYDQVPVLTEAITPYLQQFVMPDNTMRNFKAFSSRMSKLSAAQLQVLCDPQTNGGLLISVAPSSAEEVEQLLKSHGLQAQAIGSLSARKETVLTVV